jgi:hypothetical protein
MLIKIEKASNSPFTECDECDKEFDEHFMLCDTCDYAYCDNCARNSGCQSNAILKCNECKDTMKDCTEYNNNRCHICKISVCKKDTCQKKYKYTREMCDACKYTTCGECFLNAEICLLCTGHQIFGDLQKDINPRQELL